MITQFQGLLLLTVLYVGWTIAALNPDPERARWLRIHGLTIAVGIILVLWQNGARPW